MSEAHAAMHLRQYVNDDDVDTAIRCGSLAARGPADGGALRALPRTLAAPCHLGLVL